MISARFWQYHFGCQYYLFAGADMRNERGFTLIELIITILIVSILAAIGLPILNSRVNAAKWTEAKAKAGAIRSAVSAFVAERETDVGIIGRLDAPVVATNLGFLLNDLDGSYFGQGCYSVSNINTSNGVCRVTITPAVDPGPQGAPGSPSIVILDEDGNWIE